MIHLVTACADREDKNISLILHTLIKAIDFIVTRLDIGKKLSREMKEADQSSCRSRMLKVCTILPCLSSDYRNLHYFHRCIKLSVT